MFFFCLSKNQVELLLGFDCVDVDHGNTHHYSKLRSEDTSCPPSVENSGYSSRTARQAAFFQADLPEGQGLFGRRPFSEGSRGQEAQ